MAKKSISAKKIIADIKAGADKLLLMQKYELSPSQVDKLVRKLIEKGLLTRDVIDSVGPTRPSEPTKSPEPTASSTADYNPFFEQNHLGPDSSSAVGPREPRTSDPGMSPHGSARPDAFKCPACGQGQPTAFDECPACGVVVAKYGQRPREDFVNYRSSHETPATRGFGGTVFTKAVVGVAIVAAVIWVAKDYFFTVSYDITPGMDQSEVEQTVGSSGMVGPIELDHHALDDYMIVVGSRGSDVRIKGPFESDGIEALNGFSDAVMFIKSYSQVIRSIPQLTAAAMKSR